MTRIIKVVLPELDLGSIVMRASVWHASVGQQLGIGDRMLEISAGDIVVDIPAPEAGTLRRRHVEEDEILAPGQLLATIRAATSA